MSKYRFKADVKATCPEHGEHRNWEEDHAELLYCGQPLMIGSMESKKVNCGKAPVE